jgi:DNA damage-inducible protein 1
MKITITDGNSVTNFDVDTDQLVEDVKALVEAETAAPIDRTQLYFDGKLLQNNVKLNQAGVTDGGLLFLVIS